MYQMVAIRREENLLRGVDGKSIAETVPVVNRGSPISAPAESENSQRMRRARTDPTSCDPHSPYANSARIDSRNETGVMPNAFTYGSISQMLSSESIRSSSSVRGNDLNR